MIQRYFAEPYRFVPPHRGTFWCRVAQWLTPRQLGKTMRVPKVELQDAHLLRKSLDAGAGIFLAANHCRWPDPLVVGSLGISLKQYFYYIVSYHLFKQDRLTAWWLNVVGGYSVWREGLDREAIRETTRILAAAERPVVVFPEGTWFRTNDRLGPLQEGLTFMARQAAKQSERPILIHPVAIKYWHLDDPRPELRNRLDKLESRLGWRPQRDLELIARVEKLGSALLAVKETEYLGQPQCGGIDERIRRLGNEIVTGFEKLHLGKVSEGLLIERIRRLRVNLVRKLAECQANADETRQTRETLDSLLFCENLNAHSLEYVKERPSLERLSETVLRIEETVYDLPEVPVGDLGVVVRVGPALDIRAYPPVKGRDVGEPLMRELAGSLQSLLHQMNAQGPPPAWKCPVGPNLMTAGVEPRSAS